MEMSDFVNDKQRDLEISVFYPFDDPVTQQHIKEMDDDGVNPIQFAQIDSKSIKLQISLYIKVANCIDDMMKHSGTHDNDPWNYCETARRKALKHSSTIIFQEIYYFYQQYKLNADKLGNSFLFAMSEQLKSCSKNGNVTNDDKERKPKNKAFAETAAMIKEGVKEMQLQFESITQMLKRNHESRNNVAKLTALTGALAHLAKGSCKCCLIEKKLPALVEKVASTIEDVEETKVEETKKTKVEETDSSDSDTA